MDQISVTASRPAAAVPGTPTVRRALGHVFGDDGFSFKDVLDLVNPLQHIPVLGNVYRKLSGDEIAPGMRVAGGALFGGPIGAALSVLAMAVESGAGPRAGGPDAGDDAPAIAVQPPDQETPRGGWLIAAATTGVVSPFVPSAHAVTVADASATPRGGWLLAAAAKPPTQRAAAVPASAQDTAQAMRSAGLPLSAFSRRDGPVHEDLRAAALFTALQADDATRVGRLLARA